MKKDFTFLLIVNIVTLATLADGYDFPTYEEYIEQYKKVYYGDDAVQSKENYEKNIQIMQSITAYTPGVSTLTDLSDADLARNL